MKWLVAGLVVLIVAIVIIEQRKDWKVQIASFLDDFDWQTGLLIMTLLVTLLIAGLTLDMWWSKHIQQTEKVPLPSAPVVATGSNTILAKWTQLVGWDKPCARPPCRPQILLRAVIPQTRDCSRVAFRKSTHSALSMKERRNPDKKAFPVTVCESLLETEVEDGGVDFSDHSHLSWPQYASDKTKILKIAVLGDTGCNEDYQDCRRVNSWPFRKVVGAAKEEAPELVIHVGDYRYKGDDTWDDWKKDFFEPAKLLLEAAPWVMVRGNHDNCYGADGNGWLYLFYQGSTDCSSDPVDLPPYMLDVTSELRLVVIDSADAKYRCEDWLVHFEKNYKGTTKSKRTDTTLGNLIGNEDQEEGKEKKQVWLLTHYPVWDVSEDETLKCSSAIWTTRKYRQVIAPLIVNKVQVILSGDTHQFQFLRQTSQPKAPLLETHPLQVIVGNGGTYLHGDLGPAKEYKRTDYSCGEGEDRRPSVAFRRVFDSNVVVHGRTVCEYGFAFAEHSSGNTWSFKLVSVNLKPDHQAFNFTCSVPIKKQNEDCYKDKSPVLLESAAP